MSKLKNIIDKMLGVVFVKRCPACRELLEYDRKEKLCDACLEEWEASKSEVCPICYEDQINCRCGFGRSEVDSVRHLALYHHGDIEDVASRIVYSLKKSNDDCVFEFVANEMADNIVNKKMLKNTVVVGIPRNPNAIKEYGYDHAKKLAFVLSGIIGVEYADVLRHRGGKKEQKKLNKRQREENARKNCFIDQKKIDLIKGKNVLLVDDIGTTGAMMRVCAGLLKKNGALRVDCLLAAKNAGSIK